MLIPPSHPEEAAVRILQKCRTLKTAGGMQSLIELGTGRVPALLQLPTAKGPVGAVVLLHGFTSRKEEMARSIGAALFARGVASLAPDLPLHGARAGGL